MEPNSPDWEISKLYSQAFEVVKKNKLLWILGLAAAGGSFNFRSLGNSNFDSFNKLLNSPQPSNSPNLPHTENFSQVLGAATSSPFLESIKAIFAPIPWYLYALLGLEFFIILVISLIINVIYQAWVQGLLLQNTFDTISGDKANIEKASAKVMPKIKSLIWLQVVPGLIFLVALILVFTISAVLITVLPGIAKALPLILIIVAIGAAIYWSVHLSLIQIWAPRKVLLEDLTGKEAFWSGLKVARKKFWSSLLLGLVNNILVALVTGVPLVILVGLIVAAALGAHASALVGLFLILLGVPLIIGLIIGFMLLGGALNAFKAVVWTLAYQQIKDIYGQEK